MSGACETCAFGHAGAGTEPYNALRGLIAAAALIPFWCHHKRSGGAEYDWRGRRAELNFLALAPGERKVCEGWKAEVAKRHSQGLYHIGETPAEQQALRRYGKRLGSSAFDAIDAYLAEKRPTEKRARKAELDDVLGALFDTDSFRAAI